MATYGDYRLVKKSGTDKWEIAQDFISSRGVNLAFGSTIRFTTDYEILPEFFATPQEAYLRLKKIVQEGK